MQGWNGIFQAAVVAAAALAGVEGHAQPLPKTVTARNYFGALAFDRPVLFLDFPGEDSAHLVLQQSGAAIRVVRENGSWVKYRFDSVWVTGVNGIVNPRGPGEGTPAGTDNDGGLLGFAFHPGYAANRRYYVWYVDPAYPGGSVYPGTIVLAERRADTTLQAGSGESQRVLMALRKPYIYHNGGTLKFGPDGFLYAAVGDGGGAGDPENRAQDKGLLFGKFLRINVDGSDAFPGDTARNYAVPPGNPFADSTGFLPEIWAYGLRSPWKWAFHPFTGEIWLGDIGQSRYEEITTVPRGGNLGWKIREGGFCYPSGSSCQSAGLTPPVFTFPSRSFGQSVTGGVFFTGDTMSPYHGAYFFADYIRGSLWAMRESGGMMTDTAQMLALSNVVSLDKDARGRMFASVIRTGNNWSGTGAVYILESPDLRPASAPVRIASARARTPAHGLALHVLAHPDRYEFRGPDGRRIAGTPKGIIYARKKGTGTFTRMVALPP